MCAFMGFVYAMYECTGYQRWEKGIFTPIHGLWEKVFIGRSAMTAEKRHDSNGREDGPV